MDDQKELLQKGLEKLAEKQMEEMDQLLVKRDGDQSPVHTDDQVRAATLADLFSGIPYSEEEER
ncbi:hypothetical protein [Ammoniphilus resinae]|uniref:Uncharacterized protein n=1 Tax=Ammoniphilus resinae TaxID=861532 RepID=A0ABS4GPJ7_9BACL|nr:hypothetical protein [Ammoniphilus resinae]MBP1932194.1 hypothetical protein [Ammoniphilus resinae]